MGSRWFFNQKGENVFTNLIFTRDMVVDVEDQQVLAQLQPHKD